jgi:hypothetical protein
MLNNQQCVGRNLHNRALHSCVTKKEINWKKSECKLEKEQISVLTNELCFEINWFKFNWAYSCIFSLILLLYALTSQWRRKEKFFLGDRSWFRWRLTKKFFFRTNILRNSFLMREKRFADFYNLVDAIARRKSSNVTCNDETCLHIPLIANLRMFTASTHKWVREKWIHIINKYKMTKVGIPHAYSESYKNVWNQSMHVDFHVSRFVLIDY